MNKKVFELVGFICSCAGCAFDYVIFNHHMCKRYCFDREDD